MATVSEDVQSLSYYNPLHTLLHGYVWPFLIIYLLEVYAWLVVYGISDYFEAGCIVIAATAAVQVVTCLFCVWSIHVRCLLTCRKVIIFYYFNARLIKRPSTGTFSTASNAC